MEIGKKKENVLNVPNALTVLRMAMIPVYWALMLKEHSLAALIVFVAASLTDLLDGYIARKYNLITDFGKLMDPLADKLMVLSVMLCLAIRGHSFWMWIALGILLAKEGTMVVGGVILYRLDVVVYSIWIGKIAQAVVVTALIACHFSDWFDSVGVPVHLILLWIGVGLTLCALVVYTRMAISMYREAKKEISTKEE